MRSALLVCIAFAAFFANANTTLVDAFSELKLVNQSKVSGQFEQHKKIKVLKNSIVSAGSFSADQSGFVWQQKNWMYIQLYGVMTQCLPQENFLMNLFCQIITIKKKLIISLKK